MWSFTFHLISVITMCTFLMKVWMGHRNVLSPSTTSSESQLCWSKSEFGPYFFTWRKNKLSCLFQYMDKHSFNFTYRNFYKVNIQTHLLYDDVFIAFGLKGIPFEEALKIKTLMKHKLLNLYRLSPATYIRKHFGVCMSCRS